METISTARETMMGLSSSISGQSGGAVYIALNAETGSQIAETHAQGRGFNFTGSWFSCDTSNKKMGHLVRECIGLNIT
jgi:hypothetical protein